MFHRYNGVCQLSVWVLRYIEVHVRTTPLKTRFNYLNYFKLAYRYRCGLLNVKFVNAFALADHGGWGDMGVEIPTPELQKIKKQL